MADNAEWRFWDALTGEVFATGATMCDAAIMAARQIEKECVEYGMLSPQDCASPMTLYIPERTLRFRGMRH
jgi:hypothetical protein